MTQPVRLVIFDCDGTLVDSQYVIHNAMAAAMTQNGLPTPTGSAVRAVIGLSLEEAVARLLPAADAALVAGVSDAYRGAFRAQRLRADHEEPLFPGAKRVIQTLDSAGVLLAVATGKSHHGLTATLNAHGLEGLFVSLQTADRAAGKPDPEMVLNALADAGVTSAEAIVVGDTTFDMEMAQNAQVRAFGVSWGYHLPQQLAEAGALAVLGRFEDLLDIAAIERRGRTAVAAA